jgi:hypothetical protein
LGLVEIILFFIDILLGFLLLVQLTFQPLYFYLQFLIGWFFIHQMTPMKFSSVVYDDWVKLVLFVVIHNDYLTLLNTTTKVCKYHNKFIAYLTIY